MALTKDGCTLLSTAFFFLRLTPPSSAKVLGKMSAPQQGDQFSRVPPVNAKPQRMTPAGFNSGPGMAAVRRGMSTRNKALALGLGVAAAGIYAYTMYAFSQDVLLREVETEAEIIRAQTAKTSSE